jgi:hypothetical protein
MGPAEKALEGGNHCVLYLLELSCHLSELTMTFKILYPVSVSSQTPQHKKFYSIITTAEAGKLWLMGQMQPISILHQCA